MSIKHIGLMGYGEVGKIFSAALKDKSGIAAMAIHDLKLANPATTMREAGFEPLMSAAIASKHPWVADPAKAGMFAEVGQGAKWQDFADTRLAACNK